MVKAFSGFPDRLMHVHARAVVAEHRLRHEGRRLAVNMRHVVDHVFVDLQRIARLGDRPELDAEFMLRCAHLVVMLFGGDTHVGHHRQHLRAKILGGVDRRYREVAAFRARTVTEITHLVFRAGIGRQLRGVDPEPAIVGLG